MCVTFITHNSLLFNCQQPECKWLTKSGKSGRSWTWLYFAKQLDFGLAEPKSGTSLMSTLFTDCEAILSLSNIMLQLFINLMVHATLCHSFSTKITNRCSKHHLVHVRLDNKGATKSFGIAGLVNSCVCPQALAKNVGVARWQTLTERRFQSILQRHGYSSNSLHRHSQSTWTIHTANFFKTRLLLDWAGYPKRTFGGNVSKFYQDGCPNCHRRKCLSNDFSNNRKSPIHPFFGDSTDIHWNKDWDCSSYINSLAPVSTVNPHKLI